MGREQQRIGATFEDWLDAHHAEARKRGILAHVEKTEAHAKVIRGQLTYTKPGVADYCGVLDHGGRALAVEAKSTQGKRFNESAVEIKQQQHLSAVARAGGLALLLVEFRGVKVERFAVPWLGIPWSMQKTAMSVSADEIRPFGWLIVGDCYLEKFHDGGVSSTPVKYRKFARE